MSAFKTVAVLGAGTMGHALGLVHAIGGCEVQLYDVSPDQVARAHKLIANALETLIASGTMPAGDRHQITDRITGHNALDSAVHGADLVVEAVVEDLAVKRELYAEIDRLAGEGAVIASNTSHLDIFPLIPERRQARAAIAHWYTPPYIIDLVDLAPGPRTGKDVIEALDGFYRGMGKRPVIFDHLVSGYIANRLQAAIALEVADLLDRQIATPQMIDDSIRYGLSLRMVLFGHLMKQDYTGLEMARRALANRTYTPPAPKGHCETLDQLIAQGRTGAMAGAGFFDYAGRSPEELFQARDLNLLRLKRLQTEIDDEEAK